MTRFSSAMMLASFSCFVLVIIMQFSSETVEATRCSSSAQCADNQVCFSGRCQCEMGYFGLPNGFGVDCNPHDCGEESDHDQQCSLAFGQHSTCGFVEGQPRCVCTEGSVWNPRAERCEPGTHQTSSCTQIGYPCHHPMGSFCDDDNYCHCLPGYELRVLPTFNDLLSKVVCAPKRCSSDWQCPESKLYSSKCSSAGICKHAQR